METLSPGNSGNVAFAGGLLSELEMNAAANPTSSAANSEDEELDGCCVQVEVATADEDLPPAEGGVA